MIESVRGGILNILKLKGDEKRVIEEEKGLKYKKYKGSSEM